MLFSYVGPETIMPLTSVLAALIGGLLIFWNTLVLALKRVARWFWELRARPALILAKEGNLAASPLPTHFPGNSEFEVR